MAAISYLQNVGRSIGYSVIKEIKDANPAIKSFTETNSSVVISAYKSIRHFDRTTKKISARISDSKLGTLSSRALQNIKEDIHSGKFYNRERMEKSENNAMRSISGADEFDDSEFEALANGNFDFDDTDESLESMVDKVGEKSSRAVSDAIVETTDYAVNTQIEIAKASSEQNKMIYASIHADMGTINENIGKILEVATGPLTTHMENSQKFYENETKLSEERNSMLKEMLDMQKKVYQKQNEKVADDYSMGSVLDEHGIPDLERYFEKIKHNIKGIGGESIIMIQEMLNNGMIESMISSPLQAITDSVAKVIIPRTVTAAMRDFNQSLGGLFSTSIAKLSNYDGDNFILKGLKNIFGDSTAIKNNLDTKKYKKDAVPFDGITRKSIIEVIPTHLARIEAALTKSTERRYDYQTGKFIGVDKIKDNFESIKSSNVKIANMDIMNYLDDYVKKIDFGSKEREESIKKAIEKIMKDSFDKREIYNPNSRDIGASSVGLTGANADKDMEIIRQMFKAIPKKYLMQYSNNVYSAIDNINKSMQLKEQNGDSIENALFNNSLDLNSITGNDRRSQSNSTTHNQTTNTNANTSNNRAKNKNRGKRNKKKKKVNNTNNDSEAAPGGQGGNQKFIRNIDDMDSEAIAESLKILNEQMLEDDNENGNTILNKLYGSTKIGLNVKALVSMVDDLVHKPSDFVAGVIKKADTAIYELVFGVEYDENGTRKSVSAAIFDGLKSQFESFGEWWKEKLKDDSNIIGRIKSYIDSASDESIIGRIKAGFKGAGSYVKDTVKGSFNNAKEKIQNNIDLGLYTDYDDIIGDISVNAAGTRKVKKTGLVAVSEGEMIVPPDRNPYNIKKRLDNETEVKDNLASFIKNINNIPSFAAGGDVSEAVNKQAETNNGPETARRAVFTRGDDLAETIIELFKTDRDTAKKTFNLFSKEEKDATIAALKRKRRKDITKMLLDKAVDRASSVGGSITSTVTRGWNKANGKEDNSDEKEQQKMINTAMQEMLKYSPEVGTGAIIGGGVSLLTGAIGGPILGAAVGSGIALLKNSEKVNEMLFGEIGEDGKRQGGLLSKELSQNFQKYAPSIGKGAILGGITSLLPIVPGGPIVGITLGSAIGYATQNEEIRNKLFGEEGLFGKDTDKKIAKALPAMGLGAAAGFIAGPFGMVPNIVLGSAAGLATTTDKFKDIMFGKLGEDGTREGGIIETAVTSLFKPLADFTKDTIGDLTEWADKNIKQPLMDAIDPIKKQFSLMFQSIHGLINNFFEKHLGATFDKLLADYIFKPATGFIKKVTGMALAPLKFAISAPFKMIGGVGNALRNRQMNRGNADYMTADQRIAFRENKGLLGKAMDLLPNKTKGKLGIEQRNKRWANYDLALSDMTSGQAGDLASIVGFALDKEKELEKSNSAAHKKFTDKIRKNPKLSAKNVNVIAKEIKKIVKSSKNKDKATRRCMEYIAGLPDISPENRKDISEAINEYIASVIETKDRAKKFGDDKQALINALQENEQFKKYGIDNIKEEDLPKLLKYLETEQKAKDVVLDGDGKQKENKGIAGDLPSLNEEQSKRHEELIEKLKDINRNLAALVPKNKDNENDILSDLNQRMEDNWDEDAEAGKRRRMIMGDSTSIAGATVYNIKRGAKLGGKGISIAGKAGARAISHGSKALVTGFNGDGSWRNPSEGAIEKAKAKRDRNHNAEIENAASGMKKVKKTGLVAVSEGEMIIPPDLNPMNVDDRLNEENKAKEGFLSSFLGKIPNFASGGVVEGSSIVTKWIKLYRRNKKAALNAFKQLSQKEQIDIISSLKESKLGKSIAKRFESIINTNNDSNEDEGEETGDIQNAVNKPSFFQKLKGKFSKKENSENIKYEIQGGRQYKYIKSKDGEWILDRSDSETAKNLDKDEAEEQEKKSFFKSMLEMPRNFIGGIGKIFNGEKEDKKNKKGILGKIFSMFGGGDKAGTTGIIGKAIAGIVGVPFLTGMISKFFTGNDFGNAILDKLNAFGEAIDLSGKLNTLKEGIVGWLAGEDGAIGGGLPGLIESFANHWGAGFEFICKNVLPKVAQIAVEALPAILLGFAKGVGAVLTTNFYNIFHGGKGSKNLVQKDTVIPSGGTYTLNTSILNSNNGSSLFTFNGKSNFSGNSKSWSDLTGGTSGTETVAINTDFSSLTDGNLYDEDGLSGFDNNATKNVSIASNLDSSTSDSINAQYINAISEGSVSDYKNTDAYKNSLSDGMRDKLNSELEKLTKQNKNVVQVNVGTDEDPKYEYKTLQELLGSDIIIGQVTDENGNIKDITGSDILNSPTIAKQYGLNWQLTDEERQQNKEDQGLAKKQTLLGSSLKAGTRKFLLGNSDPTVFSKYAKVAKHVPFVGKALAPAFSTADKIATGLGDLGRKVVPGVLNGGNGVDAATRAAEKGKKGIISRVKDTATKGLRGGNDIVRTTNSATGELMKRSEALAKGLTEEAGDFAIEKTSKLTSIGEKLGVKKLGDVAEKESKGIVSKVVEWITKNMNKLLSAAPITGKIAEGLKRAGKACSKEAVEAVTEKLIKAIEKKALPTFTEKLAKAGVKTIGKIGATVMSGGLIGLAFGAADFIHGFTNAETVLGVVADDNLVDYDPSFTTKLICGLAEFLNGVLFFGLLDIEMLFNLLYEPAKAIFNIDPDLTAELDAARAASQEVLEEYNLANDVNMTVGEFNDKDKITTKIKKGIGKVGGGIVKGVKGIGGAIAGGAKSIGSGIAKGAGFIADKAKGAWNGAKNLGSTVLNKANDVKNAAVGGIKNIGTKAFDIGKGVTDIVSNAYKYATYKSDKKASELITEEESGNPLNGFSKIFSNSMDTVFAPLRGIYTIGNAIGKTVKGLMDFGGKFVQQIKNDAARGEEDFNNGDFESYWRINETEVDSEGNESRNPLSPFRIMIKTATRSLMFPILGIKWMGGKAAEAIGNVVNGAKAVGTAIANTAKDNMDVALHGNITDYFNFTNGVENTSFGWLNTVITGVSRGLMFPLTGAIFAGRAVVKGVNTIIDGAKAVGDTLASEVNTTLDIVQNGNIVDYFNFTNGGDETPFGWLNTVITGATRILMMPISGTLATGRLIKTGFNTIVDGGKAVIDTLASSVENNLNIAKNGTLQEYFDFSNGEDKTPFGWLNTAITGATRIVMLPVAGGIAAGNKIGEFASGIINDGANMLKDINTDREYVTSYMDKDNLDGYWKQTTKTSKGVFGGISTVLGTIDRVLKFPVVVIKQLIEKAKDFIAKPVDWIKEKVGGFADGVAGFFGLNTDSNGMNNQGQVAELGAGSGSGLTDKAHADSKYKDDPTFVSQIDSRYANKSFNTSGDSEKQTIADAGCGPAAAAMVVNNANFGTGSTELTMEKASKDALKYKVKDGGVNATYFEKEFSSHGLSTQYITDSNTKNEDIINNLRQGNRTVLMGANSYNDSKEASPFGPNNHYVVATRVSDDGKYIWVNDPESTKPEVRYSSSILKDTKLGIAGAQANGSGIIRRIAAKGSGIKKTLRDKLMSMHGRGKSYGPDTMQYKVWNLLRSAGMTEIQTAAIMGNIEKESAFKSNAIEKGNGIGFGLCQWSYGRRTQLEKYAASVNKKPSDLSVQIQFLLAELNKKGGCNGYAKYQMMKKTYEGKTWNPSDFFSSNDLTTVTKVFCYCWERPKAAHGSARAEAAAKYYQAFTGKAIDTSFSTDSGISENGAATETTQESGNILTDILGAVGEFGKAFGLTSGTSSSSSTASDSSTGGVAGPSGPEQQQLVDKMLSVKGKLKYSMSGPRNPDQGSSDCSSTVNWAYKNVTGETIGPLKGSTLDMYNANSNVYVVDKGTASSSSKPDESKLQLGDVLLFSRPNSSFTKGRPQRVGHVEMYMGNGQQIGHGSGMGPKVKSLQGYFIKALRLNKFKNQTDSTDATTTNDAASAAAEIGKNAAKTKKDKDTKKSKSKTNSSDKSKSKSAKGSGLLHYLKGANAKGSGIDPNDEIRLDTYHNFDNKKISAKEKAKNPTAPSSYFAAGSKVDSNKTTKYTTEVKVEKKSNINDKVVTYLNAILKLLSKEVENTSMLSTIVTILTELVKIGEEERSIDKTADKAIIEQKRSELKTRRMAMMNVLNSTGIHNGSNSELSKLIADAERLAKI